MIKSLRNFYNSGFTEKRYSEFLHSLDSEFNTKIDFRISETPIFIDKELKTSVLDAVSKITREIQTPEFLKQVDVAVPESLKVPNETPYADVLSIDFALCSDGSGQLTPQLIELQGFASLYFYQILLDQKFREYFHVPEGYNNFFNGLNHDRYFEILKKVIVGDSDPENVILLEIEPEKQKTLIDFLCTERWLGIKTVCISDIKKDGKKLFYELNGKLTPVERIYNRVIFDELFRRSDVKYGFEFQDELDVKFIAHPNWFFKISKFALPFLKNEYVPETEFVNKLDKLPDDIENYILKPLFSFAGAGVRYDVTKEEVDKLVNKENYILQRKVNYEPVIETPDIPAKAELRILMVWHDGDYVALNNLVRLSKGKMMGVDYNKDKTWVGSSIAYFEV